MSNAKTTKSFLLGQNLANYVNDFTLKSEISKQDRTKIKSFLSHSFDEKRILKRKSK